MNTLWNKTLLDGVWDLYWEENCVYNTVKKSVKTIRDLKRCGFKHIKGNVPGNFDLDMIEQGLLPDYFQGTKALESVKIENYHLWYATKFHSDLDKHADNYIRFEGIDTFSEIYLNGKLIGQTDNMFIEHEIRAEGLRKGENELVVHILPVFLKARENCFEAGVIEHQAPYNSEALTVRKAGHTFGWDIMPRILSGGIWRSVMLFSKPKARIENVYFAPTKATNEHGIYNVYYHIAHPDDFMSGYKLKLSGCCKDSCFSEEFALWHTEGCLYLNIDSPKLWWPKGMGDANVYDITVELYKNDMLLDTYTLTSGLRIVELVMRDRVGEDAGEFLFKINGENMFIRGTNWVPVDAFHSRDKARLPKSLELLRESNCNMVRCWGGNVYEDHAFFDFCDRNGIAVWQDFALACATYPLNEEFKNKVAAEARAVIRKLRNHPSLFLWVGDNECDQCVRWQPAQPPVDPSRNTITRQVLPDIVRQMDPYRPFVPSSPYCSAEAFKQGRQADVPEQHLWSSYLYYKADFFAKSNAHFVSETGYHGCPSPASLRKFLSEDCLLPKKENDEWLVHATNMEIGENVRYGMRMFYIPTEMTHLFGAVPETVEEFALMSQITQAEADKFFVERHRLGKWDKTTGILIWNLIDGWPQISDAVVDYYYNRKLAYFVLKRCQEPVCLSFREPQEQRIVLAITNDTLQDVSVNYKVTDITNETVVLEGTVGCNANGIVDVGSIAVDETVTTFYLIEWELNGVTYKNHYLCGKAPLSYAVCLDGYRKSDLLTIEGF